jgi:TRAP-type C4-dicarboxylate transport system permease small subunit
MPRFTKLPSFLSERLNWFAAGTLALLIFLTCGDVILRYLRHPIRGSFEISGFLLLLTISFAIAHTQILRGHIAIGIFVERFPQRAQAVFDVIAHLLGLGVFALFAWQCVNLGTTWLRVSQVSDTLGIPTYPFLYVIAFSCFVMCLVLLIDLANAMGRLIRK